MAVQDRIFPPGQIPGPGVPGPPPASFHPGGQLRCRRLRHLFLPFHGRRSRATTGFDLALTEILQKSEHYFLVEVGTEKGAAVLQATPHRAAAASEVAAAANVVAARAAAMGRELDTRGLKELLYRNYEHPRWTKSRPRCLNCGNCTWVCPPVSATPSKTSPT